MKRLRILLGVAAVVVFGLLNYKQRDSFTCSSCGSRRDVFQWRLGVWLGSSLPLTPRWQRVHETQFFHDFLPVNHAHKWVFAQGSPYYFFGTRWGGCALGTGGDLNDLLSCYDHQPAFRAFIQAKLKDGSLTKSNLVALAAERRSNEHSPAMREINALVEGFIDR